MRLTKSALDYNFTNDRFDCLRGSNLQREWDASGEIEMDVVVDVLTFVVSVPLILHAIALDADVFISMGR